jgi:hypothetical protein
MTEPATGEEESAPVSPDTDADTTIEDAEAGADADDGSAPEERSYGGLLGAFPYAFRRSDSLLFRAYVLVGGLAAALATVVFGFALVVQVANTLGGPGGTFTFSRTLFILVGLLVVAPLVAPVLFVARRHRRVGADVRYDRLLGATGFLFLVSLYLGAVASIPPEFMRPPEGPLGPVVTALYTVPPIAAPAVPLVGALLIYLTHRRLR